ncbi:2-oxoglutarate oxidoreductase [bacterium]|nr:2-oxoglutarate oxidoreductase [bacterium]
MKPTLLETLTCSSNDCHTLETYQGKGVRWCVGCGDTMILETIQRYCHDEQLAPEKTVFVSGIGCAARFPHYMGTYGFHGLHGRALPVASGIKMHRPDLEVFVNTGDGDCCSIGAGHWIHALRQNPDITVFLHDNRIYGLTKKQASPTSPLGLTSNTTPRGVPLEPLNPALTTLGVANVSFVAQVVDWMPDLLYQTIKMAHQHKGLSFVSILQRCPTFLPTEFDPWLRNADRLLFLTHDKGIQPTPELAATLRQQTVHDPSDLERARALSADSENIPVGILYHNPLIPSYEETLRPKVSHSPALVKEGLEIQFDRFAV